MNNSELLTKLREFEPQTWVHVRPSAFLDWRSMDRVETVGELIRLASEESHDSTLSLRINITREFEVLEVLFLDQDIIPFQDGDPVISLTEVETEFLGQKIEGNVCLVFE